MNVDYMENTDCIDIGGTFTCRCSSGYSSGGANSCTSTLRSLVVYKANKTYALISIYYCYMYIGQLMRSIMFAPWCVKEQRCRYRVQ